MFLRVLMPCHDIDITMAYNKRSAWMLAGYMQMTSVQESIWAEDAEQYVADEEEETFSARASGELLLDSLLTAFGREACSALACACQSRLQHADHLKVVLMPMLHTWKLCPACFHTHLQHELLCLQALAALSLHSGCLKSLAPKHAYLFVPLVQVGRQYLVQQSICYLQRCICPTIVGPAGYKLPPCCSARGWMS